MANDSKSYILNVRIIRKDSHNRLMGELIHSPIRDNPRHHVVINYQQFMPKGYRLANGSTANYVVPIGAKGPKLKFLKFKYVQVDPSNAHQSSMTPKHSSITEMIRKNQTNLDRAEADIRRYNDNLKKILSDHSFK